MCSRDLFWPISTSRMHCRFGVVLSSDFGTCRKTWCQMAWICFQKFAMSKGTDHLYAAERIRLAPFRFNHSMDTWMAASVKKGSTATDIDVNSYAPSTASSVRWLRLTNPSLPCFAGVYDNDRHKMTGSVSADDGQCFIYCDGDDDDDDDDDANANWRTLVGGLKPFFVFPHHCISLYLLISIITNNPPRHITRHAGSQIIGSITQPWFLGGYFEYLRAGGKGFLKVLLGWPPNES